LKAVFLPRVQLRRDDELRHSRFRPHSRTELPASGLSHVPEESRAPRLLSSNYPAHGGMLTHLEVRA
jgi:hypothetical protein